jgi:hypothetical protein
MLPLEVYAVALVFAAIVMFSASVVIIGALEADHRRLKEAGIARRRAAR